LFKYVTRAEWESYGEDVKVSRQMQEQDRGFPDDAPGTIERSDGDTMRFPYQSRLDDDRMAKLVPFDGEVVLLIDTGAYSSGEMFAADLRAAGAGTLIGEPTGGGGSVPGDQLALATPNTGLQMRVSYKFFRLPPAADDGYPGVLPDYHVSQTLDDFRAGRDTMMDFVCARWR